MTYLYSALSRVSPLSNLEGAMFVRAKQNWFRRIAFAGAVLATAALCIGTTPWPAAAQYYGAAYPGYAYPYPYYPYYPYYYPYYAYGYPYWAWPYGITVGLSWGGWWGGGWRRGGGW